MQQLTFNTHAVIQAPFGAVALQLTHTHSLAHIQLLPYPLAACACKQAKPFVDAIQAYLDSAQNGLQHLMVLPEGTTFQQKVWLAMSHLAVAETMTYQDLAVRVSSGARAVANACGANPLPLIIPCHRVVAKNGLGGFMQNAEGGLKIKRWLLQHEGCHFD